VFRKCAADRPESLTPRQREVVLHLIDARLDEVQRALKPLGRRLSKQRPKRLVARLQHQWDRGYQGPDRQTVRIG
jgi:hypothetical protein